MLTISQVTKSFAGRILFEDVSLQVNRGDRIGLVGPNGAGKSTLFSLILGEASPDEGKVSLEKNMTLGFLPQEAAAAGEETVLELACGKSHQALEDEHDWQLEPKAKRILAGLAFRESDFERPASALSGGWVMRAHLARLLVHGAGSCCLLDEPTNHLDLESLVWFQEYLRNYPGAILMISHDREFLNHARRIHRRDRAIEAAALSRQLGQLRRAESGARRAAALRLQEPAEGDRVAPAICRSLSGQGEQGVAGAEQAQADRSDGEDRGADCAGEDGQLPFSAAAAQRAARDHAEGCRSRLRRFGRLRGLNFSAERGQRTVLVGPNGAGKSTLLKLLAGVLPVQSGERELGHNVKVGYFSQHRVEMLNVKQTVLESVLDVPEPGLGTNRADRARLVPLSRRRCFQNGRRA